MEVVSLDGQSLGDVPCTGVRVSFDGGQAESWRGSFRAGGPGDGAGVNNVTVGWALGDDAAGLVAHPDHGGGGWNARPAP